MTITPERHEQAKVYAHIRRRLLLVDIAIGGAMSQHNLSARAYHRILKLARTIADLEGCEKIESAYLAVALTLRNRPKLMMG